MSLFNKDGKAARTSAASPATIGAAIEVPLQVPYLPPGTVLRMASPGAATWIHEPRLENVASVSLAVDAATAISPSTFSAAGYWRVVSPPFPAAATTRRYGFAETGKSSLV